MLFRSEKSLSEVAELYLSALLKLAGLRIIDNRGVGNCLWVVPGDIDFAPISTALAKENIHFHYCESSKIVKKHFGKIVPAWWTNYNEHPEDQLDAIQPMIQEMFAQRAAKILPRPFVASKQAQPKFSTESCNEPVEMKREIIKENCRTCSYNFDCPEALAKYFVGCDRYTLSYEYKYGNRIN